MKLNHNITITLHLYANLLFLTIQGLEILHLILGLIWISGLQSLLPFLRLQVGPSPLGVAPREPTWLWVDQSAMSGAGASNIGHWDDALSLSVGAQERLLMTLGPRPLIWLRVD